MQQIIPVPFWTASRKGRNVAVTGERLVNWHLVRARGNEKFQFHLAPDPGLKSLVAVGDGPIRGMQWGSPYVWVVSGGKIYRVSSTLTVTELGDIAGTGHVDMAWNGTQMLVTTTAEQSYSVDEDGVRAIAVTGLQDATYQEGYGAAIKRGTEDWYISAIDDMEDWAGLDYTNADAKPDKAVAIISAQGLIWVFGDQTVEFYQNTGNATFPFERVIGQRLEVGCIAHGSVAIAGGQVMWLGQDESGALRVYRGMQAQPVSTAAIERDIQEQTSPQTAHAFVYALDGQVFYVLSFSALTLQLNLDTGLWNHRKSQDIDRWRAEHYCYAWRKRIVGDWQLGQLYELDPETFDDDGDEIRREGDSAPFWAQGDRATMWELFIDAQMGVGLDGDQQGDDPVIMMRYSDDEGHSWSAERTATLGKIGEYKRQARFHGLGQFEQRTIRLAVSDPVRAVICGVYARIERMGAR